jgi:hypothetical protein
VLLVVVHVQEVRNFARSKLLFGLPLLTRVTFVDGIFVDHRNCYVYHLIVTSIFSKAREPLKFEEIHDTKCEQNFVLFLG